MGCVCALGYSYLFFKIHVFNTVHPDFYGSCQYVRCLNRLVCHPDWFVYVHIMDKKREAFHFDLPLADFQ